jgi:hypothetical protein
MPREIGCFRFRSLNSCRSRPRPASGEIGCFRFRSLNSCRSRPRPASGESRASGNPRGIRWLLDRPLSRGMTRRCSRRALRSTRRSFVNVAPWGCDLPTRRQPKHRVQIICTPDQWSAREDVQGRAMSPTRSISYQDCAHPIGALSWRWPRRPLSPEAGRGSVAECPSGMLEPHRGCRAYFTQDRLDIRQRPAVPGMRGR